MSLIAEDVFADRATRYIERNPDASVPEVLGRFLAEPTDEHREFVENVLAGDVEIGTLHDGDGGSEGAEA